MAKNYLRLTFLTDSNHIEDLRVERPLPDLTDAQIKSAMEGLAAVNIYECVSGKLVKPVAAELITVDETELVAE